MNIIPNKPLCEVLFSRESTAFNGGHFVYTEERIGSSPISPTNLFNSLVENYEFPGKFIEPTAHLWYGVKQAERALARSIGPNQNQPVRRSEMATPSPIIAALFWSKVRIPDNHTDCWVWQSTVNDNGYGRFSIDRGKVLAHRYAHEALKGPIPDGMQVRHLCHNRLCCNPMHLDFGTAKQNAQDSIDAGRFTRGVVNGNAKLTDEQVIHIRQNPEKLKSYQLAEKFGVSTGTISSIKSGKIWRHVAPLPAPLR